MILGYHLATRVVDNHLASALLLHHSLCWPYIHPVATGAGLGDSHLVGVGYNQILLGVSVGPAGAAVVDRSTYLPLDLYLNTKDIAGQSASAAAEAGHFPSLGAGVGVEDWTLFSQQNLRTELVSALSSAHSVIKLLSQVTHRLLSVQHNL